MRLVWKSWAVRVATFNLLHGVPLRDHRDRTPAPDPSREQLAAETQPADESGAPKEAGGVPPTERAVWSPPVTDPAGLVAAVEELLADGPIDVMALQEVDRHQPRTGEVDQARIVAELIGAQYWRFVPSVRGTPGIASEGAAWVPATAADDLPGDQCEPLGRAAEKRVAAAGPRYGIALLSRFPVRNWRVRRFPPAPVSMPLMAPTTGGRPKAVRVPDEPRSAVSGIVELPYADVTVATAHLSFVPGYNARQLNELRAFLAGQPRPMLLMGDFNTPGGIPGLVTGWQQVARRPTYPVTRPRVQFDHIMADGWTLEALDAARTSARAVPLPISDHCALVAEFPEP